MRKTIMTVAAFIFSLWAACADTVEYDLVWRGVRTWSDSLHTVRTIGLDNAVYPDQTGIPVLMWEIASPDVDVADVRHAPLTYAFIVSTGKIISRVDDAFTSSPLLRRE